MVAEHGAQAFPGVYQTCITSLKTCIDFQADSSVKGKKTKLQQFHHARDNAVAALGKIIKFQAVTVSNSPELVPYWLDVMPLTHDMEEA